MPGVQDQFSQELTVSKTANFLPGSSYRLGPNADLARAEMLSDDSAACDVIPSQGFTPPQDFSEDAGSNGGCLYGSVGPAPHAAPQILSQSLSF